jgi:pyruvate/2-oxoglutarate dehydrogenase complex dihydrolipoamide acyltransferase (E2) component
MATEVTIPNLGYTMTRAKVLRWLKSVGDNVEAGEPILEIETDKVTYAIESPTSGVVKAILAKQGDEVPVGEVVAILGGADEKIDISIYWGVADELHGVEPAQTNGIEDASLRVSRSTMGRVLASPLAKKIASEKGT